MTLEEMRASDKPMLTPQDVAGVLGCDPYNINVQAREGAEKLGFPVCMIGSRVKIPRMGFLHWLEYGLSPVLVENGQKKRLEGFRDADSIQG